MKSIYDRLDGIYAYIEAKAEQVERQCDELIERSKKHKHGMTESEKARRATPSNFIKIKDKLRFFGV